MPNEKLPALETFNDASQVGNLRSLRQMVLKNRSGFFASARDGNDWFREVDQRLARLELLRKAAAAPAHPDGSSSSMSGRPRGADLNSHLIVKTVSPVKQTDGAPLVKVMNDPIRSMAKHRPTLVEQPMQVKVTSAARPALRPHAAPAPAHAAPPQLVSHRVAASVGLLQALDTKHRHASMMGDVFGLLRQAALDARHGNSEAANAFITQAEDLHKALVSELEHEGVLSVVRPPAAAPDAPPVDPDKANNAQGGE